MKYSENLNLALPSSDNNEDIADINPISHNFEIIDEVLGNFIDVVCNALKGSAEGNPVRLETSPLEHEIAVGLRSKNLFNLAKISDNTVIVEGAGTPASSAVFATSDYIAVPPNTAFVGSHIQYCTYYDKDKKYVGDIGSKSSTIERALTTPANAHYVRFSYQKSATSGSNVQLEIGSTLSAYSPYVNVSGAKVHKYGKNLLPYPYLNSTRTESGITFIDNGDGTVVANGTATGDTFFFCSNSFTPQVVGEIYHLTGCPSGGGDTKYALDCYGGGVGYARDTGSGISVTPKDNSKMTFRIVIYSGASVNNLVFKPMLALGTTATENEPYIEPTEYIADENGNVSVTSVYPTTTLIADNGVSISAEYNRDINKVIADIIAKIGGI